MGTFSVLSLEFLTLFLRSLKETNLKKHFLSNRDKIEELIDLLS